MSPCTKFKWSATSFEFSYSTKCNHHAKMWTDNLYAPATMVFIPCELIAQAFQTVLTIKAYSRNSSPLFATANTIPYNTQSLRHVRRITLKSSYLDQIPVEILDHWHQKWLDWMSLKLTTIKAIAPFGKCFVTPLLHDRRRWQKGEKLKLRTTFLLAIALSVISLTCNVSYSQEIVIDHTCTDLSQIPNYKLYIPLFDLR